MKGTPWVGTKPLVNPAAVQFHLNFYFFEQTLKNLTSIRGTQKNKKPFSVH
jgi:hypothetical protein